MFAIEEDARGNFWISSNRGIYRVKRQELNDFADGKLSRINSVGYGTQDGMLSTECNGGRQPASITDQDGRFWFPTQDGVVIVDPRNELPNTLPPSVVIESAMVERVPVDIRDGLTVPPGRQDIEIHFAGVSLIKSAQVKFRYKLEGHDADWANSDGLTAIPNRRRFEEFLADEWRRAIRVKTPVSLVMLDIDHFKLFNDTYGHHAGDECLKQVADALRGTVRRPTDLLTRYGGEEFAIILGGTDAAGARKIAEQAVDKVNSLTIPHRASPKSPHLTVSVGIATMLVTFGMLEADLIKAADDALYRAKAGGRNQIVA
ncbi:MAG: diguanylate cyclase [Acidobacteriota bacterium]|nr:diguanylate cyclase [Acidobacteriota bacterium]